MNKSDFTTIVNALAEIQAIQNSLIRKYGVDFKADAAEYAINHNGRTAVGVTHQGVNIKFTPISGSAPHPTNDNAAMAKAYIAEHGAPIQKMSSPTKATLRG